MKITYILICLACLGDTSLRGEEHIVFEQDGKRREVRGEVLVTAEDGGVLLTDRAGVYWAIQKDEVVERNSDDTEFTPLSFQQVEESLLAELPAGFSIHRTKHYVIAYATTPAYARWCGSLYERLYRAFTNVWSTKHLKLKEPQFPLVAIIFPDRASYIAHAQGELGDAAESIIGFYSLQTNHMTMYDLSGMSRIKTGSGRVARSADINRFLRQPGAAATVATIVHEATHQIAYNCGLHTRFADVPLWLAEGMAVYFESPDLSSTRGWRTAGELHPARLATFRKYVLNRPDNSLETLLRDDTRFREGQSNDRIVAYAESWALNYFLIRKYPKQYVEYLRQISDKPPMVWDEPEERIAQFEQAFGMTLRQVNGEFVKYMMRAR